MSDCLSCCFSVSLPLSLTSLSLSLSLSPPQALAAPGCRLERLSVALSAEAAAVGADGADGGAADPNAVRSASCPWARLAEAAVGCATLTMIDGLWMDREGADGGRVVTAAGARMGGPAGPPLVAPVAANDDDDGGGGGWNW